MENVVTNSKEKTTWNYQKCLELASSCESKNEFRKTYTNAFNAAYRNNWLDDICREANLSNIYKEKGYWSFERVKEALEQCKDSAEFKEKYNVAYTIAYKRGWLEKLSDILVKKHKPKGYWTLELIDKLAKTCSTKVEFIKSHNRAYQVAHKNGWLEQIFSHIKK